MKVHENAFKPWFIGFVMLTNLLLVISQKAKPPRSVCSEAYPNNEKCDVKNYRAECLKKRKIGNGECLDIGKGKIQCRCYYNCPH
ncbi:hypothetical protein N665_0485s0022 [Sinapis alba]|nr:hypothetical protein N665_0485s0022 [Sinapis alba]